MFSAAEIADLHATYAESLTSECVISRNGSVMETVACAVMRPRRWTMDGAGGFEIGKDVDFTVSVPAGTDLRTGDSISVNDQTLRVGEIIRPGPTYDHALFAQTTVEA